MKFRLFWCNVFVFCFKIVFSQAQEKVIYKGIINDDRGRPVPHATITALDTSTRKILANTTSNLEGSFSLQPKTAKPFLLYVKAMGLSDYERTFTPTGGQEVVTFDTITLKMVDNQMTEVTVTASRPVIQILPDRTIVQVAGTVLADGATVFEVLGRSPGIIINNAGNIQLQGKGGVSVLIDGRQLYMSSAEINGYLKSIPAEQIQRIEIINSPSATNDAEGSGGIVDIRLKKNLNDNMYISLQGGGRYNRFASYNSNGTFNYNTGGWRLGTNTSYRKDRSYTDFTTQRKLSPNEDFDQLAYLKRVSENQLYNLTIDHEFNERHLFGVTAQYSWLGDENNNISNAVIASNFSDPNHINALNNGTGLGKRLTANVHYLAKFDTIGSQLSVDLDFVKADYKSASLLQNSYSMNEPDRLTTDNPAVYDVYTVKGDYTKVLDKSTIYSGVKTSWVSANNKLTVQRSISDGPWEKDENMSNQFLYDENIISAYAQLKQKLGSKFDLQTGLRYEGTHIFGHSLTNDVRNNQKYHDFFPNAILTHKLNEKFQIAYSYNRRITRPNYRLLNPFSFYVDPYTLQMGSPGLIPMYSDNYEINQIYQNKYQFALGYSNTSGVFSQVFMQGTESGLTVIQIQNLNRQQNFNTRLTIPVDLTTWWNSNNMLTLNYITFDASINNELLQNQRLSYIFRSQHQLSLPHNLALEMISLFVGPNNNGLLQTEPFYSIDLGVRKSFFYNRLQTSINGRDIFRSLKTIGDINFGNISTQIYQYNSNQSISVTLTYRFDKGKTFLIQQRSGSKEEQDRIN